MSSGSRFIAAACAVCFAAPVHAQSKMVITQDDFLSVGEIGGGVSIQGPADVNQRPTCEQLALPCESPRTMPDFGISALAAIYINEIVGVAGEVSAYANAWVGYGSRCYPVGGSIPSTCAVSEKNHVRTALAGLKLRTPLIPDPSTHWRLFAQVLAGPQWSDVTPALRVVQAGVGADNYLRNGLILHVQYDYRFAPADSRDLSTGRFLVGLAMPIGERQRGDTQPHLR